MFKHTLNSQLVYAQGRDFISFKFWDIVFD